MRFRVETDRRGILLRSWITTGNDFCEWAYLRLGLKGIGLELEFPSDWHEHARWCVHLGFGFGELCFSGPWYGKLVPDEYQCKGPTYGFKFFSDLLMISWGKDKGTAGDPYKCFHMPWAWRFIEHRVLSVRETHDYTYRLRSGEAQHRKATIYRESRSWWRPWLPWRLYRETINVDFDDEVGEESGSWKGGTIGCGWDIRPGESELEALRRMERERKFQR